MSPDLAVLRSSGSALVLDTSGPGLPRVLHWGADLPDDAVAALPLLAQGPVPHSALDARQIVEEAMTIPADICIYTNRNLTIEEL